MAMVKVCSEKKIAGSHNEKPRDCRDWLTPCRLWRRTRRSCSNGRSLARIPPRASRPNTPDPEEPRDYTAVLQMVKTVRDQLTALVLDNTNIQAACDDLRRQCHSQGVAFGDLSRLVSQTRGGPRGDQSIWGDRTAPSYPARAVGRWR